MRSWGSVALMFMVAASIAWSASPSFAEAKQPAGASIFSEKCSMCHGTEGKGFAAIKTPDFTDPKWQAAHPDKELHNAVENGVPGTAMVSFKGKLTQPQMEEVLKYIRSLGAGKKKQ